MKPLSLKSSLKLYELLESYFPEDLTLEFYDFVSIIIDNIKESNNHNDYIEAITMMSGISEKALLSVEPGDALNVFIDGISINNTIGLVEFCRDIGLYDG